MHQIPNFNVLGLGVQLSLRNILKPSVKWRMKMYIWVISNLIAY